MANQPRPRSYRLVVLFLLLSVLWTSLGFPAAVQAQDGQPPLDTDEIRIVGLEIQPSPATLVVPKNTGTIVTPLLIRSDGVTGETPALPADAFFVAELRGPAFKTPVPISAPLNGSFPIPPLALPGNYTLEQIRLVHNGETLITSDPSIVGIEVIDRVLETQVTVTPLTAEEIQQRGIFIDQSNYQVVNFTVAFGLENNEVEIDFPMILPKNNTAGLPGVPTLQMPAYSVGRVSNAVPVPALEVALKSPNIELTGFSLSVPEDAEPNKFNLPPIPGVVIIPGNIGYLNQFFSVMLKVSNAAPGYANLVVKDLKAEIILPTGGDTVIGTSDDPLRMARLGNPPVEQAKILPVVGMGADKVLGTADDVLDLAPQTNADAEFLVEGLREGAHRLNFKITGTLHGLPSGPLPIEGTAVGMVEVRNPKFSITLHHPETITAGELYDFMVTVTNISETPANFVSLSLLPNSISGALLKSPSTQSINTIEPGDSATVVYQLEAQKTGTVTSNSIAADGIPGKFELYTAVGELGIPMSPNVLLLPKEAKDLPADLYNVGIGLLGQAYAVATAPFPPKGLLPISRDIVYERAIDLAAAGQRIEMGEALGSVARDIALDFLGNNFARVDSQYAGQGQARIDRIKSGYTGFDTLLRKSRRGEQFMNILAGILNQEASANGLLTFQQRFAEAAASRPAHLSVVVGNDGGTAPVTLSLVDPLGKRLGIAATGETQREIPFANYFPLQSDAAGTSALALLASPQNGRHVVEVTGTGDGVFDLGVVVPANGGLQRLTFEDVAITVGAKATLVINVGGSDPFELRIDDDGDGALDRTLTGAAQPVVDQGPQLIAATQVFIPFPLTHPSKYGLLIAALFSEEVDLTSAEHNVDIDTISRYFVDNNRVRSAFVQPRGRVVTMYLRDGIGPFVQRSLTATEIQDVKLNSMAAVSETVAIRSVKQTANGPRRIVPGEAGLVNGTVRRADGTPVPNARIYMSQREIDINDEPYWVLVTVKDANADGTYSIDYVRTQPTKWEFLDPATNERGQTGAQPSFDSQSLTLDLILRGRGTLTGKVTNSSGQPLAEAFVRAKPIANIGLGDDNDIVVKTNADGNYVISGAPVGTLSLTAVHPQSNAQVKATAAITEPGSIVVQDLTVLSLDFPQNFGTLQGQVFREDGVTPAPNVPVYTSLGGTAVTDASGSYRIENLPVGEALIRAIDQEQLQEATIRTNIVADSTVTANLLLFGGTGTVRGAVRDSDGNPLPGVSIYGGYAVITTDAQGEFVIADLPLGNRQISAFDSASQQLEQTNVTLTRPGEEAVVQIVFPVRGTLTGKVFRADGVTIVPNLKVFALGPKNEVGLTDQNGAYRFENMPKGDYTISTFFPDWSDGNVVKSKIVFKNETRVVNVIFRGKGTVTGTVYDDDGVTPLGARVAISEWEPKIGQLIPKENPQCLADIDLGGGEKLDLPDCENVAVEWKYTLRRRYVNSSVESGQFNFANTFVGDFVVEAANPFSPQVISVKDNLPVFNATRAVTLSLQSTGVVSGVVLLPDGTPATGRVLVRAQVGTVKDPIVVTTDSSGRFSFPLMPAVPFNLTAEEDYGDRLVGRASGQVKAGGVLELPIRLLRTGSVTVTVQGAGATPGTFQPVPGAQVTLNEGAFTRRVIVKNADANGVAVFSGGDAIREGNFSVNAVSNGVRGFVGGTLLNVTQDPTGSVAVTVTLRNEAASISGRFLRTDGVTGIPNAQIVLRAAGETVYATSGVTGTYRFDGVPTGTFTIEGFDPVTSRRGRTTGQVTVADHNTVLTANMTQAPLGNVLGSVRMDADNAPVVGAEVILTIQGPFPAALYATTDSNGVFQFNSVPAGPFSVRARDYITNLEAQTSGSLSNEGQTANAEIRLTRQPTGSVTGVVTGTASSPATGARVTLTRIPQGGNQETTVDSQGRYTFTNVPLGGVRVIATPQLGGDQAEGVGEVSSVGDVEVINLGFRGTATVDGTVLGWQGSAAAGTEVTLTRKDKLPPYYNRTTTADSSGFFRFERVPLGEFDVTANQRFQQLGGSAVLTVTLPDATAAITVSLEPAGTISGTVRREDGATVAAQMAVELTSADGTVKRYGSTDANGNFSFADLKLSSYSLLVSDPLGVGYVNASTVLTEAGQIRDLGVLRLDDAPPAVVAITPANGAIYVPVTQTIGVTFSEPVQAATITNTNLVVSTAAGVVTGTWTLNAEQTQATFTPNVRFRDFTGVSVRVRTGIQDRVGRSLSGETVSSFTTTDATPPSFVTRSPAPNSQGAPVNGVIRVQWSEALDTSKFSGSAITVTLNGVPVTPARPVEFLQNNTVAVFTPLDILESDTVYEVTVAAATDLFGNRQAAPAVYTFRTQDLISPVLSALGLPSGTVLRTGETALFTPTLDTSADVVQVEYFVDGTPRFVAVSAPFTFSLPVNVTQAVTTTVAARATDFSGNRSEQRSVVLDLRPDLAPVVTILSPAAGTTVRNGERVTMTVRYADDFALSRVLYQARGVVGTGNTVNLPAGTQVYTGTFSVVVPSNATPDSLLTLETSAVDNANQASAVTSVALPVVDGSAPSVQFLSPANNSAVDAGSTVSVTVRASDNGKIRAIGLDATGAAIFTETRPITPTASPATVTFAVPVSAAATSAETITLVAVAEDEAGNRSAVATWTLRINAVDASAPQVTLDLGGRSEVIRGQSITATVVATDDVGLSALRLVAAGAISETQNVAIFPTQPRATNAFVVSVPVTVTDGSTFTLTGLAVDGAGNQTTTQPVTITVVADVAPQVVIDAPAQVGSGQPLTVTLSAEDDQGVAALRFNAVGAVVTSTTRTVTPTTTRYTETVVLTVPAGAALGSQITLSAVVTDTRNQTGAATPVIVTVADVTKPTAQVTSHANGNFINPGEQTDFTVRATDNGLVHNVELSISGEYSVTVSREISPAVAAVNVGFPLTIPLSVTANSTLTLTAVSTDTAGNVSQPWVSTVRVRDVIKPEITATVATTEVVRGRAFTVTLDATDNAGVGSLILRTTGAVTENQSATINPAQTAVTRTFSVNVPAGVALGSVITVTGEARDAIPNQGFSAPITLTVVESTAQLSGVVRNLDQQPVNGAEVFVRAANGTFTTVTAEDGSYALSGLADGFISVDVRDTVGVRAGRAVGTLSGDAGLILDVDVADGVLAESFFADDAEGWTSAGGNLTWLSGNDYIAVFDQNVAETFYFDAPSKFLGDMSAAYGSVLSFSLRRSLTTVVPTGADVILVGDGLSLYYSTHRLPTSSFQLYTLPLDLSTTAWTVDSPTGPTATEADFLAVLGDLQALRIRGDYGGSYGYLDNVTIRTATTWVRGTLTDAADQPLASNPLTVTASSGVYAVATDVNGEYTLPGIGFGAVNVTAIGPDGLRRTVTGNLAAGQSELNLNVKIAAAPAVTITAPVSGTTVLEGATIPVTATATAEFGIARVIFLVNGNTVFTDTATPFRTDVTVPLDVTSLTLAARAEDVDGNATMTESVIAVSADDNTTVSGRVLDGTNGNAPVEGATITLSNGLTATSGVDGVFTIVNVPTAQGTIQAIARATLADRPLQAIATAQPVPGGVTDLGDMLLMVTKFWDGGGNNTNWQTAANWNGDTLPTASDDVYIPVTATVTLNSGAATINSLYSDGVLSIGGGTLSLAAQSTVYSATLSSGVWTGAGDVTITGQLRWSGGTLSGAGTTVIAGTALLDGAAVHHLDGRTLENRGVLEWTSLDLYGYNGARFVNTVDGVIDLQSSADFYWQASYGAQPTLVNEGTLIRSAAAADSLNVYATLVNSGTVEIRTGTLAIYGGGSSSGDFNVDAGATLRFNSSFTVTDADIRGAGTTQLNSGTLTVNGVFSGTAATVIDTNSALLQVNDAATLGNLTQTNGTVTGSGVITVSGVYTWSAGTVSGAGTLIAAGGLRIDSTSTHTLDGRTLENRGSAVWTAGSIHGYNGARLINAAGATFAIQTDSDFYWQSSFGARPVFENNGTLISAVPTADPSIIYAQFVNRGAVTVQSGVLRLEGTGAASGTFDVNGGAILRFRSDFTLESTSTVSGAGTVDFNAGIVTLNGGYNVGGETLVSGGSFVVGAAANVQSIGGLVTVSSGTLDLTSLSLTTPALAQSNGVITGTGVLTVSNVFTWTGGTMSGSGTTVLLGNSSVAGSTSRSVNMRTLENRGSLIWTAVNVNGFNAARMVNASGATFDIRTDADFYWQDSYGARPSFENAGTLIKSVGTSNDPTILYSRFVNSGAVQVQAGVLTVNGGGEGSGSVNVAAGAVLRTSSNFTWNSLTVSGAGTLEHNGSNTTLFVNGSYSNTTTTRIAAGTVVISPTTVFTTANLTVSGGALTLSGDTQVDNAFTWSGGEINGVGRLIAAQSMVIDTNSNKTLSAVTVENRNSAQWTGGDINVYAGARIVNAAGATFSIQTVDDLYWQASYGARPVFENFGTLVKAGGGVDRTEILLTFNNLGSTVVQTQTLNLANGTNSGSLTMAAGATLQVSADYTLGAGTVIGGAGVIDLTGGSLNVSTGGALTVPNLLLNGGTLTGSDVITVNNFTWRTGTVSGSGVLRTDGATLLDNNTSRTLTARTWENAGTVTWVAGTVSAQNGGTINNLATGVIDIRTDGTPITYSGARPVLNNAGTIVKRAGTGTTTINHVVNNSGVVRVETGTLSLVGGGDSTGVFEALPGARIEFNGQTHNLSTGSVVRGQTIRFASGTVNIGGTLNVTGTTEVVGGTTTVSNTAIVQDLGTLLSITGGTFNLNHGQPTTLPSLRLAGSLSGNSAITVTGPFTWTSGTVSGSGVLRTDGATLLDNNTSRTLTARAWENAGNVTWLAGFVSFQNGGVLNNLATGVIDIRTDGTPVTHTGTRPVLTNAGTLIKSAGTGTALVNHDVVNNGVVQVQSGVLSVNTFTQSAGGRLTLAVGGNSTATGLSSLTTSAAATLTGTLAISRSAAYLPTVGESLPVLSFNSRSGEFATVEGTAIDAERAFQLRYDDVAKRVVLDVVAVNGVTAANSEAGLDWVAEESTSGAIFLPLISSSTAQPAEEQPAEEQTPVLEETSDPLGWNGGAGDGLWRNEGNWSTRRLPTAADSVDLASAVVRVDSAAAVGVLSHSGELILDGGALNVGDAYTQNGALTLVLGGSVDPLLAVAGRANLAGLLNVMLAEGFDPAIGERFTVMVYGERVGEFANGEIVLGNGKRLLVVYNDVAGVVVLEVAPAAPVTLGAPKRSASPEVMTLIEAGRLSVRALQSGVDSIVSGESRPIPWLVTAMRQIFLPQMQR